MKTTHTIFITLLLILGACKKDEIVKDVEPDNTILDDLDTPENRTIGLLKNQSTTYPGYTLFNPRQTTSVYLIDNDGRLINEWKNDKRVENSRLLDNGLLLRAVNLENSFYAGLPGAHGRLELVDWDGNIEWQWDYSTSSYTLHHDVVPIKQTDGSYHFLASSWEVVSSTKAISDGRNPDRTGGNSNILLLERILEIKPVSTNDAEIVWEWGIVDHLIQDFDNSKNNYGNVSENPGLMDFNYLKNNSRRTLSSPDWNHVSGIGYNADLDQIVFSNHGSNELMIIDHSTTTQEAASHAGGLSGKGGDILYRWGNPNAHRAGARSDAHFEAVHAPYWIPNDLNDGGKIMVFNNGFNTGTSSLEILVPPVNEDGDYIMPSAGSAFGPNQVDWLYEDGENFFSGNMGNGVRLPNGNTLINEAVRGRFFEINENNEIIWEYINPVVVAGPLPFNTPESAIPASPNSGDGENEVFKIHKYALDFPGFESRDLTPGEFIETY